MTKRKKSGSKEEEEVVEEQVQTMRRKHLDTCFLHTRPRFPTFSLEIEILI